MVLPPVIVVRKGEMMGSFYHEVGEKGENLDGLEGSSFYQCGDYFVASVRRWLS